MNLSEIIYSRLTASEGLAGHLTSFLGQPAVFTPEAPEDNQPGWDEKEHYPRIEFTYDLLADEKRQSTGTLTAVLLFKNTADVKPEAIEKEIIKALCDVVLMPDTGIPYCFAWARTDGFTIDEKSVPLTMGSEIRFDIIEYPSQITSDPDPIMAVCRYIKDIYPESVVLGYDRIEPVTEVTKEHPVIYCRLKTVETMSVSFATAWMEAGIAIHVICPQGDARLAYLSGINYKLAEDAELIMMDEAPMQIENLKMNNSTDYLKAGQITFSSRYGMVRHQAKPKPLNEMNNNLKVDNKGGARWVVRKKP